MSDVFADHSVPIKAGAGWLPGDWLNEEGLHQAMRAAARVPAAQVSRLWPSLRLWRAARAYRRRPQPVRHAGPGPAGGADPGRHAGAGPGGAHLAAAGRHGAGGRPVLTATCCRSCAWPGCR
ncbi:hypothetical protein ACU4GD_38965 [Cupriavidus basilensis]